MPLFTQELLNPMSQGAIARCAFLNIVIGIFVSSAGVFAQTEPSSVDDLIAVVNGEDSIKSAKAITEIGNRVGEGCCRNRYSADYRRAN